MAWTKLKNIIIVLLICVNLSFLILIAIRGQGTSNIKQETKEAVHTYLRSNNIELQEDNIPWDRHETIYITERDQIKEEELVKASLGEINERQIGSATKYTAGQGTALFHEDGRFSIEKVGTLDGFNGIDQSDFVTDYLNEIGISAVQINKNEQEKNSFQFMQSIGDMPVFNCVIYLEYQDNVLQSIHGRRLLGEPVLNERENASLSSTTLIARFVQYIKKENIPCSTILQIESGYYYMSGSLSINIRAIPVWKVTTDYSEYYLNCMTGEIVK